MNFAPGFAGGIFLGVLPCNSRWKFAITKPPAGFLTAGGFVRACSMMIEWVS